MIYFDTSAFVKLAWAEKESTALRAYLDGKSGIGHVSSKLLVVEARRAALRIAPVRLVRVDAALEQIDLVDVSDAVIGSASRRTEPALRSLDAIHLATALMLGGDVDELITYDQRLSGVAKAGGMTVVTPV
ncbi:MAG: type II toxin-antitoxin system VapC family toxin [Thermocrispum sp.]